MHTQDSIHTESTLRVEGAVTLDSTVAVAGAVTLSGSVIIGGTLAQTGVATFAAPPVIPTIAFASLPAATVVGQLCYCATGDGGSPGLLITDGTNWLAMSDGATAAET